MLYIAEKRKMAEKIAKCFLGAVRKDGYYETSTGDIITWVRGHILQPADPHEYDPKYQKWDAADLPIIPAEWRLKVSPASEKQFKILKELISKASVIVHAGDPDREGQLLLDELLIYVNNKKQVKRLLIDSLDEKTIKKALLNLKENEDFYTLQQSGLARSQADWMIGINFSRAFTIAAQRAGHEVTLAIGRVKTPTLSLVVRREEEIKKFTSKKYYIIRGSFRHSGGAFETIWQPKENQLGLDIENQNRLADREIAEELIKKFRTEKKQPVVANYEKTQQKEPHQLPYSLSELQIEAGRRFGYSPQEVLDEMQKLYEGELTTYPRSDCEYLPETQIEDAAIILGNLKEFGQKEITNWANGTDVTIKSRAWNDKKITAHHAIIPTCQRADYNTLSEVQANLYYLIAQAYIAQFYPLHVFDFSKITINFADETFTTTGRVVVTEGWKSLYRKGITETAEHGNEDENAELPMVKQEDLLEYMAGYILDKITEPPIRFTKSTLLKAMKEIYKYVKNQELKKKLKDVSGIGTEATRASIIEEIIDKGFLIQEKKYLIPHEKSYLMVSLLPDELTYPDSTAEWEMTFQKIVDGSVTLTEFLDQQKDFITNLCKRAETIEVNRTALKGDTCPTCNIGILKIKNGKNGPFWGCSNYPTCRATFDDKKGKPDLEPPVSCPICKKGSLKLRNGKNGKFWSCTNFNECKATFDHYRAKPMLIECPTCKQGFLKKKKGSNGDFFGCSQYPSCSAFFEDDKGKPKLK